MASFTRLDECLKGAANKVDILQHLRCRAEGLSMHYDPGILIQKLLPLHPPLFTPEFVIVNEFGTLLVVAGPCGVLVLQLPERCPPYGAFDNNKEVVYCRFEDEYYS
nr:unnamed protein product [Callosobruchus analis]